MYIYICTYGCSIPLFLYCVSGHRMGPIQRSRSAIGSASRCDMDYSAPLLCMKCPMKVLFGIHTWTMGFKKD